MDAVSGVGGGAWSRGLKELARGSSRSGKSAPGRRTSAPRRRDGFTLIELVVAATIFLVLLGVIGGMFATFVRGQRIRLGQTTLLGDVQTFLELLEREVRTGYGNTFRCAASDPTSAVLECAGPSLVFTNQERKEVSYALNVTAIERGEEGVSAPYAITGRGLEVRDLRFSVAQSGSDRGTPPQFPILTKQQGRVTIRLRVCPRGVDDGRCIVMQTSLTSRQYGSV